MKSENPTFKLTDKELLDELAIREDLMIELSRRLIAKFCEKNGLVPPVRQKPTIN